MGEEVTTLFDADHDLMLWWLILQTRELMHKARTKELRQYGVTPQESQVLWVVKGLGYAPTPAEIARILLREPHAISAILIRMEKKGLVQRTQDSKKKNMLRIIPTEKAFTLYPLLAKREVVHEIMSVVAQDEREHLRPILKKLRSKSLEVLKKYSRLHGVSFILTDASTE